MRKVQNRVVLYFALVILASIGACTDNTVSTFFSFLVQTDDGKALDKVDIYVNGKKVGRTDSEGIFLFRGKYEQGNKLKVEVVKESKDFFYSDYREIITIPKLKQFSKIFAVSLSLSPKTIDLAVKEDSGAEKAPEIKTEKDLNNVLTSEEKPKKVLQPPPIKKPAKVKPPKPQKSESGVESKPDLKKKATPKVVKPVKPIVKNESEQIEGFIKTLKGDKQSPSSQKLSEAKAYVPKSVKSDNPLNLSEIDSPTLKQVKKVSIIKKDKKKAIPKAKPAKYSYYIRVVDEKGKAVHRAKVFIGWKDTGFFEEIGYSNKKGKVRFTYFKPKERSVTLFVQKDKYFRYSKKITLRPSGRLKVKLFKAVVIDVHAFTKEFYFQKGVGNIEVFLNKKSIGLTDQFGRFSYQYNGPKGELINLKLKSKGYVPGNYSSDLVIANSIKISKAFQKKKAPSPKIGFAQIYHHSFTKNVKPKQISTLKNQFSQALRKQLFAKEDFLQVKSRVLESEINKRGLLIPGLVSKGWSNSRLNPYLDAVMIPELIVAKDKKVFFNVYTATGKNILSMFEKISSSNTPTKIAQKITQKLRRNFPFEGAIIEKLKNKMVKINLGSDRFPGIKAGDEFDIHGMKFDRQGKNLTTQLVGTLKLSKVNKTSALAKINNIRARSAINVGDRVVRKIKLRARPKMVSKGNKKKIVSKAPGKSISFVVRSKSGIKLKPISEVNLYVNGTWLGTTNSKGVLKAQIEAKNKITVLGHRFGYSVLEQEISIKGKKSPINLFLSPRFSSFIISTVPNGKVVYIDGKRVGRSPILKPVQLPLGYRKLKVMGGAGFKNHERVLEVTPLLVNLSGPKAIKLEKDFLSIARKFEQKRAYEKAILYYKKVKDSESDYPRAQNAMGRIYLDYLKQPEKAVESFEQVFKVPEVKEMVNKQYTVTYTNLGTAYFQAANKSFNSNQRKSALFFKKAYESFLKANMYSKYFPIESHNQIKHDTLYFLALTYQKLFYLTERPQFLQKANIAWKDYIDFYRFHITEKTKYEDPIKNAKLYLAEVKASMQKQKKKK